MGRYSLNVDAGRRMDEHRADQSRQLGESLRGLGDVLSRRREEEDKLAAQKLLDDEKALAGKGLSSALASGDQQAINDAAITYTTKTGAGGLGFILTPQDKIKADMEAAEEGRRVVRAGEDTAEAGRKQLDFENKARKEASGKRLLDEYQLKTESGPVSPEFNQSFGRQYFSEVGEELPEGFLGPKPLNPLDDANLKKTLKETELLGKPRPITEEELELRRREVTAKEKQADTQRKAASTKAYDSLVRPPPKPAPIPKAEVPKPKTLREDRIFKESSSLMARDPSLTVEEATAKATQLVDSIYKAEGGGNTAQAWLNSLPSNQRAAINIELSKGRSLDEIFNKYGAR